MTGVVDPYNRRKAVTHLDEKRVVIFTAGTANPFFSTDWAACLRAVEIDADVMLEATGVEAVYSEDPMHNPHAQLYKKLTYDEVLHKDLKVMDMNAICLCRDYNLPLRVFNMTKWENILAVVLNRDIGTTVEARK